jgi:hypothetical protein
LTAFLIVILKAEHQVRKASNALTQPLNEAPADQRAGEVNERLVNIGTLLLVQGCEMQPLAPKILQKGQPTRR